MAKLIAKITLLTLVISCSALLSKAQMGNDYGRYDVGFSAGFNQFYGDVNTSKSTNAVNFNFNYNQGPFVNLILEGQFGKLAGGAANDPLGRQFAVDYQYYAFRIQLQAGEIIDYSESSIANAFKNLYVGTGIGIIYDNVSSIVRYSTAPTILGHYTPGDNKSNEVFLPVRIGYEFKIFNQYLQPNVKIDIGYQYNNVFGDELDGYRAGHFKDAYSQFTIGAKFAIGGVTSYRKQINYFH